MVQVKCIKTVSIGSLDLAFEVGNMYSIPLKEATEYTEYFKKISVAKTKIDKTDENKEASTGENK